MSAIEPTPSDQNETTISPSETPSHASWEDYDDELNWDIANGDISIYNQYPKDTDIESFLQRSKTEVFKILHGILLRKKTFKYSIVILLKFTNNPLEPATQLKSKYITLENAADIEVTYDVLATLIVLESWKLASIHNILRVEMNIKKQVLRYGMYIELPAKIGALKAAISYRYIDNFCFKCALLIGAKYMANDTTPLDVDVRSNNITYRGTSFNFTGLTFPVEVWNVGIFERNNPSISVNVFGLQSSKKRHRIVGPLYRTRREQKTHFNLLFIERRFVTHYMYITKFAKLMQGTKKSMKPYAFFCNTCLSHFKELREFELHKLDKDGCDVHTFFV